MAVRIYNSSWKDDLYLMQQLKKHNSKEMRLQEILSYMKRDSVSINNANSPSIKENILVTLKVA